MKEREIVVSICCAAYNHEPYIASALNSFIMQITDFNFEILIHDDASTDQTASIIRKFEEKYPNLIKPIFQKENQYSQGKMSSGLNLERALGKYIAICEGDDFWIDPIKLQKQVNYLESHPNCSLCSHRALKYDGRNFVGEIRPYKTNRLCKPEDVILSSGNFIPTASYVFPRRMLIKTSFGRIAPVGDYARNLLSLYHGDIYYFDDPMSVYRVNIPDSHLSRMKLLNANERIFLLKQRISMLKEYDLYSKFCFSSSINYKISMLDYNILLLESNKSGLKKNTYYRDFSIIGKLIAHMKLHLINNSSANRYWAFIKRLRQRLGSRKFNKQAKEKCWSNFRYVNL